MARYCIGKNGIVENVVEAETTEQALGSLTDVDVFLDPTGSTNVNDVYDVKDVQYDKLDIVTHRIIFQLVNDVRVLKGQGTITAAQYKAFVKSLMD